MSTNDNSNETMNAIVVEEYGGIGNLISKRVPKPEPGPQDVLVKVRACSVNPVDTKVRAGIYDDYPDYYDHVPLKTDGYHILGFDGAGIIMSVGSEVKDSRPGDEVFYSGSPTRQGSNAEFQAVDSRSVAKKPKSLDWAQAASMPLTWITAYEALVERMGIQKGETAGIFIVNGAGGVGSVASQVARWIPELPVVITTAGRKETEDFSRSMGATHVVNHREGLVQQVQELKEKGQLVDVEIKYIFLTHSTSSYLSPATEVCAPFGTICFIVQTQDFPQYGTRMMAKSQTFVWELLGTKSWYGVDIESHGRMLAELSRWLEEGKVRCHHTQSFSLDVTGLREAQGKIEGGGSVGKNALTAGMAKEAFQ